MKLDPFPPPLRRLQTLDSLRAAFVGTALEQSALRECWNFSNKPSIFVVDLLGMDLDVLSAWKFLRALPELTGRYPVIVDSIDVDLNLCEEPPSSRREFEKDEHDKIFTEALTIDVTNAHPNIDVSDFDYLDYPLDHPGHFLGETLRRFGDSPTCEEVVALRASGLLRNNVDLQRWLFNWELERFGDAAIAPTSTVYLNWYFTEGSDQYVIMLPPTPHMWEASTYMPWFGTHSIGESYAAATLRNWGQTYGAELVAALGTMLHVTVERRPATLEEAFSLAVHQLHFASDTLVLPGISLREHARALYAADRWFFHSRP